VAGEVECKERHHQAAHNQNFPFEAGFYADWPERVNGAKRRTGVSARGSGTHRRIASSIQARKAITFELRRWDAAVTR